MNTSTNFSTMKFIVSFTFVILFSSLFVGDAYGSISFEKGPFTWTDKIRIKISEYGVDGAYVKISTSTNQLLDYKLSKVRDNLYTGEVILTGFLHDVDGDGKPDTNPRTMGRGSNNGFLEITRDGEFKIFVRFADGDKISQSVKIRWNTGTIAFDKPNYTPNESAKLQVTDADMNLNPEALDTIQVFVFSDTDKAGIKVKAIETQEESGLFETTVSFTQDRSSSGNRLFAISGDMIYAQYNDYTLPKPYRVNDDLEIIAESTIFTDIPISESEQDIPSVFVDDFDPLELWASNELIIDGTVIEIDTIKPLSEKLIRSYQIKVHEYFKGPHKFDLINAQEPFSNKYFKTGERVLFYLYKDNSNAYQIHSASLKTFDNCTARDLIEISPVLPNEKPPISTPTFNENSVDSCVPEYYAKDPDFGGVTIYAAPLKQVKVGIEPQKVQCQDPNKTLVFKIDGSPACVKEQSVPKLIERGWVMLE